MIHPPTLEIRDAEQRVPERWADLSVLAIAALWLFLLARQAAGARLQSDECFHAVVSQWIATHHTLPETLPQFYSGFAYYYPPLFHVLGGVIVAIGGGSAFRVT